MTISYTILDHQCLRHMPEWVRAIVWQVAERRDVPPREIMGRTRVRSVVLARHEAIYRVKSAKPDLSAPQIAQWFRRDHTTILYAIAKYQDENSAPQLSHYRWRDVA